jgi:hypothetical protein
MLRLALHLTARATDNAGSTISVPINITVNPPPNVPPTISISSPAEQFTAPAIFMIKRHGWIGATGVLQWGYVVGHSEHCPYTFSWNNIAPGNPRLLRARIMPDRLLLQAHYYGQSAAQRPTDVSI